MDTDAIVQAIDAEIDLLGKVRALLTGQTAPLKRGLPLMSQPVAAPKRRKFSAESVARMAAAQRARRKREKEGSG